MLLVAVLIRCEGSGPVLYRQLRPGLHGEPFQIVKFRSMRPDPELERLGTDGDHVRITHSDASSGPAASTSSRTSSTSSGAR